MNNLFNSIVITGAGGMVGRALTSALHNRNLTPIALTREQCNIASHADLERAFQNRPTVLFNCAAYTKVDQCELEPDKADAINGYALGNLAELCINHRTLLVHISTDFIFDGRQNRPYKPDDAPHPLSAYGRSKLLGETQLRRPGLRDWLIVRTAWVYGRHGANFPRTMVTAAREGKPLSVVTDQIGSPTYAVDLAEAILTLIDVGVRGIWHVTNSGQTSWYDFAKAALAQFGVNHPIAPTTAAEWRAAKPNSAIRPAYSVMDIEPFNKLAGRQMRPWQEALCDFHAAVERDGF
jgi:dTDP-4-dehydrorhamnose reductase